MLGEKLEPVLPQLAALQRGGAVSAEKVAIVERAMHQLSRQDVHPENVDQAEQLLTDHAVMLAPPELRASPMLWSMLPTPTGRNPSMISCSRTGGYLELKQRRDGMWHLTGRLTNTVGAQLNAILDPLANPGPPASKTRWKHHPDPRSAAIGATAARRPGRGLRQAAEISRPAFGRRDTGIGRGHHQPGGSVREGRAGRNR